MKPKPEPPRGKANLSKSQLEIAEEAMLASKNPHENVIGTHYNDNTNIGTYLYPRELKENLCFKEVGFRTQPQQETCLPLPFCFL